MVFWNTLRRRILLARKLSLLDWLTLAAAWLGLFFFALALRLSSAERLEIPSLQTGSGAALPRGTFEWAERLHRLVELASRLYPLPMTCLPRALALRWMLARRGIDSVLQIGAQSLLRHTAGSRLFMPELLTAHLAFCSSASAYISMYQIKYPHIKEGLPIVGQLLENLC